MAVLPGRLLRSSMTAAYCFDGHRGVAGYSRSELAEGIFPATFCNMKSW
jgi:hypothetical protein